LAFGERNAMMTTPRMEDDLVRAIAQLGKEHLAWEKQKDLPKKERYLSDPCESFLYFLRRMFFRGRPDWLSEVYANETLPKVEGFLKRAGWGQAPNKGTDELNLGAMTNKHKKYKFPSADFKMVYGAIEAVSRLPENNVVKLAKEAIEEGSVSGLYKRIFRVPCIKDKLACMFLRDVGSLYDLLEEITDEDVDFFLPVDTWVRQFCHKLRVCSENAKDPEVKSGMVEACKGRINVSPIDFDHGLWVVSQLPYVMSNFEFIARNVSTMRIISESSLLG
jgi:hypothetical protein